MCRSIRGQKLKTLMSQILWWGFMGIEGLEEEERERVVEKVCYLKRWKYARSKMFSNMTSLFPDLNFRQHIDIKSIWKYERASLKKGSEKSKLRLKSP